MAFHRYATFEVLASGYADAQGTVPAEVSRVGGTGSAFVKSAHRHNFVYDPKPGYLYVRSRAISSRTNDNFDTFPAHAIKAAWGTFIGKPVFVNHHNANHRRMRGVIIDAALHEDLAPDGSPDTWTEVLMEIDAVRFPKLAEAVVKGWIDRTSMGTEVALSTCSFCGNQASNPTEYCRHIPAMKGQRIIRTQGTKREAVLISEICEGLHFFENSLLVEAPADPTAFTFGMDTRGLAAEKATAHLVKAAASLNPKEAALAAVEAEALAADAFTGGPSFDRPAFPAPGDISGGVGRGNAAASDRLRDLAVEAHDKGDDELASAIRGFADSIYNFPPYQMVHSEEYMQETFPRQRDAALAVLRREMARSPLTDVVAALKVLAHPNYAISSLLSGGISDFEVIEAEALLAQAAVDGTGPCGAYGCTCPAYRPAGKVGSYDTCECGHSQNVHAGGETKGGGVDTTQPSKVKRASMRKGAPFAGYEDFEACVAANQDKGDPQAYCGSIKHKVEDKKTGSLRVVAGWFSDDPEYHHLDKDGVGEAVVSEELEGNPLLPTGNWTYDAFRYDDLPARHRGVADSLAAAKAECESYLDAGQMSLFGSRKTALGEQRAPAQVDTLRMDSCPVCGDDDGFDGTRCRVCQFVKPPDLFGDPDVEKAKQVDLRGGDVEQADDSAAQSEQLQCDHCGKTFPLENKPKALDTTQPGAGQTQPQPDDKAAPAKDDDDPAAPKGKAKPPFPPKKKAAAFDADPDEVQQGVQPESGFGEQPEAPESDGPLADGSTCPVCGVGTLHIAPVQAGPQDANGPSAGPQGLSEDVPVDGQQDPAVQDAVAPDEQGEPGTTPGQQAPADNPVHPDHGTPPAPQGQQVPEKTKSKDSDEQAEDEDDDEKGKSAPPWFKKKKDASHRAGSASRRRTVDMGNPAQEKRNRIFEAIRAQQSMITAQADEIVTLRRAVATLATAAGVGSHPHFASLVTAADEEKDPVATTDEQALKPDAKDDPESIGAAPGAANSAVTPAATTDVNNSNVALPAQPLNDLTDVTAPTGGTDVPKGDAAHVETDVKVGQPSNEPFPDNSGWKKSSLDEDPQVRFMASLRLAKARKEAGIVESGIEDVSAAQQINDDANLTLSVIQHEINTLAAVAAHRTAPAQQVQAARSLVPQRAEVPRTMPSLSAQASGGVQPIGQSDSGLAASQVRDSLI